MLLKHLTAVEGSSSVICAGNMKREAGFSGFPRKKRRHAPASLMRSRAGPARVPRKCCLGGRSLLGPRQLRGRNVKVNLIRLLTVKGHVYVRQEGLRRSLVWLLSNCTKPKRFAVFVYDIGKPLSDAESDPDIEVRHVSSETLRAIRESDASLPVEFFYDTIYGFSTCFLTFFEAKLAMVTWVALPGEYNPYFKLRSGEVEVNQIYILPQFRSLPLSLALIRVSTRARRVWLKEQGYKREYARIELSQGAWMRLVEDTGYQRIGTLTHFLFYCPKFQAV